jgi:tetratricopeptide (TPR) repeat protein
MTKITHIIFMILLLYGPQLASADVGQTLMDAQRADAQGQSDRAITLYRQVLNQEGQHVFASNQLGLIFARKGDYSSARRQFQKTLSYSPKDLFAQLWVGVAYLGEENLDGAFQQFQRLAQRETPLEEDAAFLSNAQYFLGAIYTFRRDPSSAAVALEKARRMNVTDPDIRYRLGKLFHDLGDVEAAEREYRRVLVIKADHIATLNALGWLLHNRGDRKDAMDQWEKVLRHRPDNLDAKDSLALAYLEIADEHRKAGRTAKAVATWRKVRNRYDRKNRAAKFFLERYGK